MIKKQTFLKLCSFWNNKVAFYPGYCFFFCFVFYVRKGASIKEQLANQGLYKKDEDKKAVHRIGVNLYSLPKIFQAVNLKFGCRLLASEYTKNNLGQIFSPTKQGDLHPNLTLLH